MVQAINRIHSKNTIVTHTDDCYYIYDKGDWLKASTNYYKYFDTDISTLNVDDFELNDYIISYKSSTNHIKFSETFKPSECKINNISQWSTIGLIQINSSDDTYKFPNTNKIATKFQTNNLESEYDTEHSISQIFYTNPNILYIASCMIKKSSTTTNNIALQLFDDTYNFGITANFDLSDQSGYDISGHKTVPVIYLNSNYNVITTNPAINHLDNVSAHIYRFTSESSENYYRIILKFSCDFYSQMKFKLLILNSNSDYKYSSKTGQEKYNIFVNAFQLEKHDDLSISEPSDYIVTNDKSSTLKLLDKIYKVHYNPSTLVKEIIKVNSNLYYIYDIKEHVKIFEGGSVVTYLKSFKPAIDNPNNGDIAVVPSIISFTEYNSNKNIDSTIRFGDRFVSENPSETINYDLLNSQYIIKDGDSYKVLSYITEEKNRKSMVKAMTFNQGYFETWCKQDRGDLYIHGYNTGGGYNYNRLIKIFSKL